MTATSSSIGSDAIARCAGADDVAGARSKLRREGHAPLC